MLLHLTTDALPLTLCSMRFALCGLWSLSLAGFDTDPADVVAEVEGLRKDLELFVASDVVEVFRPFRNGLGWTDGDARLAGAAILA